MDYKEEYNKIISFIRNYYKENKIKGFVLGVSGGKDSTLVAKLLIDAVGKEHCCFVYMPHKHIDSKEKERISMISRVFEININILSIMEEYCALESKKYSPKAMINVVSRLQMTNLYAIAQTNQLRVVGTRNKSELYIGWCTKWGDMACDINPIAHLLCTDVVKLGLSIGIPSELMNTPSEDDLSGKTDEENFGFLYQTLDNYIRFLESKEDNVLATIDNMHDSSRHKFKSITLV